MDDFRPPRPVGNTREAQFMQRQWDAAYDQPNQFRNAPGARFQKTARGIFLKVDRPRLQRPFFYPFKVYASPANPADDPEASALWRTFRVRAGLLGSVNVLNTDGADQNPDDPGTPVTDPDYNADIDIIVPNATAAYYIWVDATDVESPFIDHGATIPGDGTDADWWRGIYYRLAIIDTNTDTAIQIANVRQTIRDDIPLCGTA